MSEKSNSLYSKWICWLLLIFGINLVFAYKADIPLDEPFVQIKNFSRVVIQPEEMIRFQLEDYFRGNLLTFDHELRYKDGAKEKIEGDVLIKIDKPVKINQLVDFSQTADQMSLPQTSTIYRDKYENKYFIFIDYQMRLYIYNITLYLFEESSSAMQLVSSTDLSLSQFLSDDKQCTNLLPLDEGKLLINCKSTMESNGVSAIIDITDMTKVTARFFLNGLDFNELKESTFRLLTKINYTYIVLVKMNRTNCFFDIYSVDGYTTPKLIRRINTFDEPPLTEEQISWYDSNSIPDMPKGCTQDSPIITQSYKSHIDYMQIQDVEIVPYYENMVVASDYNYGLLFMHINCTNLTYCYYRPYFIIKSPNLSEISVLKQDNILNQKRIFVQISTPPGVLEVNVERISRPILEQYYSIKDDEDDYVSIDMIDVSYDYIATHLLSTKEMKPVIRLFKRISSYFSIGHSEFKYIDFIDSGTFMEFINVNDNFILLKTSDYFGIYKVQRQDLVFNASDYTTLSSKINFKRELQAIITVQDYYSNTLQTAIDIVLLEQQQYGQTYRVYNGNETNQTISFSLNCGGDETLYDLKNYFSGTKQTLMIEDQNGQNYTGLFYLTKMEINYLPSVILDQSGCQLNQVVQFTYANLSSSQYFQCLKYNSEFIYFYDMNTSERLENKAQLAAVFNLRSQNIINFDYDTDYKLMFVLSDQSSYGNKTAQINFFSFYNVFSWDSSINLIQRYSSILGTDFRFKQKNSLHYEQTITQGCILSQPKSVNNNNEYVFVVFTLSNQTNTLEFKIKSTFKVTTPSGTTIIHNRVDPSGYIWSMRSDNSLYMYQVVEQGFDYFRQQNDGIITAKLRKSYQFNYKELQGLTVRNFRLLTDRFIIFFGDNQILLSRFYRGTYLMERQYILPVNLGHDIGQNYTYKFVYNTFRQQVVSQKYNEQYLLVLFKRSKNNVFDGYTLFAYDITQSKHNTMIFQHNLDTSIIIDESYAWISILPQQQFLFEILLLCNETTVIHLTVAYYSELSQINSTTMTEKCQQKQFDLNYKVYPTDNEQEYINIKISAKNTGLIIYPENSQSQVTFSYMDIDSNDEDINIGKHQMIPLYHGQNMRFNLDCLGKEGGESETNICASVKVSQQQTIAKKSIEFLGNQVKLLGLFIVEPVLLFFDSNYLNIYQPQYDQYSRYLKSELFYQINPDKLLMFLYRDQYNNETNFLFYQSNVNFQFGVSIIYSSQTYDVSKLNTTHYMQYQEIYIFKTYDFLKLTQNITFAECYVHTSEPQYSLITAILVFHVPNQNQQSIVRFQQIEFNGTNFTYTQISKVLSVADLQLDTFRINSIMLSAGEPILLIGIEDFGFMIYNISSHQVIKLESMMSKISAQYFYVTGIIQETIDKLNVVINNNAIYTIRYYDGISNDCEIVLDYFEEKMTRTNVNEIAANAYGFAFIQRIYKGSERFDETLRFFSFFNAIDTKAIGHVLLEYNQKCQYLQPISYDLVKSYYIPTIEKGEYSYIAVCGSTLVVVAYNYYPRLRLDLTNITNTIEESRQVAIEATNYYTNPSIIHTSVNLTMVILNNELRINPGFYVIFGISPILVLLCLSYIQRRSKGKSNTKNKKKKNNKRYDTAVTLQTQGNFDEYMTINPVFRGSEDLLDGSMFSKN